MEARFYQEDLEKKKVRECALYQQINSPRRLLLASIKGKDFNTNYNLSENRHKRGKVIKDSESNQEISFPVP